MKPASPTRKVWSKPLLLAALTVLGLLSALLGEHVAWKALGCIALAVPVVTGIWLARPR